MIIQFEPHVPTFSLFIDNVVNLLKTKICYRMRDRYEGECNVIYNVQRERKEHHFQNYRR
jgi:hypothetical protein